MEFNQLNLDDGDSDDEDAGEDMDSEEEIEFDGYDMDELQ